MPQKRMGVLAAPFAGRARRQWLKWSHRCGCCAQSSNHCCSLIDNPKCRVQKRYNRRIMEEAFFKLLGQSPWMAVAVYLIWRLVEQQSATLSAYKDGAESTRQQSESLSGLAGTIESMEKSLGFLQMAVKRSEAQIDEVHEIAKKWQQ